MNVDRNKDDNNNDHMETMIGVIYAIPHKVQTKNSHDITFTSDDKLKNSLDGPLYIVGSIYDKHTKGILIDIVCGENMIT
jgi:hypothetical protein